MIIRTNMPLGLAAINNKFISVGRGRMVVSDDYKRFKEALAGQVTEAMLKGPVAVSIAEGWTRTHRTGAAAGLALGDVDSPLKCILDALQLGGAFENDAQVVQLVASKSVDPTTIIEVIPWNR